MSKEPEGDNAVDREPCSAPAPTRERPPSLLPAPRLLYHTKDLCSLADLACYVRRQIEVFAATPEDKARVTPRGGLRHEVDVGRVGVRCVHCRERGRPKVVDADAAAATSSRPPPPSDSSDNGGRKKRWAEPPKASVSYPKSVRLVYQSARNLQRHHFPGCPDMPDDVRARLAELKDVSERGFGSGRLKAGARYWEESCRAMGMIDTDRGIHLRGGVFADEEGGGEADGQADNGGTGVPEPASEPFEDTLFDDPPAPLPAIDSRDQNSSEPPQMDREPANITPEIPWQAHVPVGDPWQGESDSAPCAEEDVSSLPSISSSGSDQSAGSGASSPRITGGLEPCPAASPAPLYGSAGRRSDGPSPPTAPRRGSGPPSPPAAAAEGGLLRRVELALCAVRTVRDIRRLPSPPGPDEEGPPFSGAQDDADDEDLSHLGAELYELLSGRRPFEDGDLGGADDEDEDDDGGDSGEEDAPADAGGGGARRRRRREKRAGGRRYVPLREVGLPTSLCALVSSLIDNRASGGYQYRSIDEVEEDLRLMQRRPERYLFNRPSGCFRIPENALHGREEEMSRLLEAYDLAVSAGSATSSMVLISGYSGTGKSTLVRGAESRFIERGACFVMGKFDARQVQPLSAIVSALDDYCDFFTQEAGRLDKGRQTFEAAVGDSVGVLAGLIPNLCKLVDVCDDHPPAKVDGKEAMQRLLFLFRMLLRAMCSLERPVVLFLDDIQWADEVSMELIKVLATDSQIRGLFFICCCREEVGLDHPLRTWLERIRQNVIVTSISVSNLDKHSVNALVSDTLQMLPRMTQKLSEAVLQKTGGNALFVVQFLVYLFDEGLLRFSLLTRQWEWDIDSIRARDIADNVVELMSAKMLRLAPGVRDALQLAACFGAQCEGDVLQILDREGGSVADTVASLDVAVAEGLMVKSESKYHFSHDQIHRAAYQLISKFERTPLHLRVGRSLWRWASADELETYMFVIVDQLHRGSDLITDCGEKAKLAQLSLIAGQKAVAMSAFLPASFYFKAGVGLLSDDDWETHRQLCHDLHNSCAEVDYVLGRFEDLKVHLEQVLGKSRTLQEKLRPYYTLVQSLGAQGNTRDAVNTAIVLLGYFGESFPSAVSPEAVQQEMVKTLAMLESKKLEDLLSVERVQNSEKGEVMKFLDLALLYEYADKSKVYFALLVCRMVQLSLIHGVFRESAVGFACFGILVGCVMGEKQKAYRYGKLALAMIDRFNAKESLAKVFVVVYGVINCWIEPLQASLPCFQHAVGVGLSTGDNENAMINANSYCGTALHTGYPLDKLVDEIEAYSKQMLEYNQTLMYAWTKPVWQTALNLLGRSANPIKLIGEAMDEDDLLQIAEENSHSNLRGVIYFMRLWLAYLFQEYNLAAEMALKNQNVEKTNMSRFPLICNHAFYSGLAALALARKEGRAKWMNTIEKPMAHMKKMSSLAPWNCQHKLELMKAECAYLEGNTTEAAKLYDSAVHLALEHRFVHDQALALERAALFYLEIRDSPTASRLFEMSYDCYMKWGALCKANQVKELYL